MPKNNRFADTVDFIRNLPVQYAPVVAELLDGFNGAIPPTVDAAMSMGLRGTETTRKYRRAMVLILCVVNNTSTTDARKAVDIIANNNLQAALSQMLRDVAVIYGGRTLTPVANQFLNNPLDFLTNHRIKLGSGTVTTSGPANFDFSWNAHDRLYFIEPHNDPVHSRHVHASVPGYNIHVQLYSAVKDELHNIEGSVVTGELAVTTQLTGCCIIYRVAGPNLTVAHIKPDDEVRRFLPQELANLAGQAKGVVLTHRMIRDGNMAGGGTLGIFGKVASPNETAQRTLGDRRIRTHGYADELGMAYFIGVKVGGSWRLFGQQNNPYGPAGVARIMQLYP